MPGKNARQKCPAKMPGKNARQKCPANSGQMRGQNGSEITVRNVGVVNPARPDQS
jgi:hypothetical protein